MNLQEFYQKNEWPPFSSKPGLEKKLRISLVFLGQLVTGKKKASLDLAFRIEAATGGAVTAREIWKAQKLRQAEKH